MKYIWYVALFLLGSAIMAGRLAYGWCLMLGFLIHALLWSSA